MISRLAKWIVTPNTRFAMVGYAFLMGFAVVINSPAKFLFVGLLFCIAMYFHLQERKA